jgi:hypothetical protein
LLDSSTTVWGHKRRQVTDPAINGERSQSLKVSLWDKEQQQARELVY